MATHELKTKNITVTVTPTVHRRARVWAAERNTSLSAVVEHFLSRLPSCSVSPAFPKPGARRRRTPPRMTHLVLDIAYPQDALSTAAYPDRKTPLPTPPVSRNAANPSATPSAADTQSDRNPCSSPIL